MTETEWLVCTDSDSMVEALRFHSTERKARLFLCARGHLVWHLLSDERSRNAVETAERFIEGLATSQQLEAAYDEAGNAVAEMGPLNHELPRRLTPDRRRVDETLEAAMHAWSATDPNAAAHIYEEVESGKEWLALVDAEKSSDSGSVAYFDALRDDWLTMKRMQAHLLRDIFGPFLFRPIALDGSWLTPTATSLAKVTYDARSFDRVPILADALEEAGCTNAEILAHCRGPGPHVRGCWVVDLILGKT